MILIIRVLPLLVGCLTTAVFWWQRSLPGFYPWLSLSGVLFFVLACLIIAGRRISRSELIEIMAPSFILLLSLVFGILLIERTASMIFLAGLAGVASLVALELLFLQARNPALYPVNGLSHLNVALVPLAIWYAVSTSAGLLVFLHTPGLWHVLIVMSMAVILFRTTNHRDAKKEQKNIWMVVGGLAGLGVGLIGLILPVSIVMQGFLAALILAGVLRVRRYLYEPKPSRRTAWLELSLGFGAFVASIVSTKWL